MSLILGSNLKRRPREIVRDAAGLCMRRADVVSSPCSFTKLFPFLRIHIPASLAVLYHAADTRPLYLKGLLNGIIESGCDREARRSAFGFSQTLPTFARRVGLRRSFISAKSFALFVQLRSVKLCAVSRNG